ncbi:hypothetical protein GYMLUDRAFT_239060 [Collybiopsis luxurians FD-317 M1]|nr:hypothetical protein GYMLUDRAFT_239060 [Collybiopsis luxurians FD-317 M1]
MTESEDKTKQAALVWKERKNVLPYFAEVCANIFGVACMVWVAGPVEEENWAVKVASGESCIELPGPLNMNKLFASTNEQMAQSFVNNFADFIKTASDKQEPLSMAVAEAEGAASTSTTSTDKQALPTAAAKGVASTAPASLVTSTEAAPSISNKEGVASTSTTSTDEQASPTAAAKGVALTAPASSVTSTEAAPSVSDKQPASSVTSSTAAIPNILPDSSTSASTLTVLASSVSALTNSPSSTLPATSAAQVDLSSHDHSDQMHDLLVPEMTATLPYAYLPGGGNSNFWDQNDGLHHSAMGDYIPTSSSETYPVTAFSNDLQNYGGNRDFTQYHQLDNSAYALIEQTNLGYGGNGLVPASDTQAGLQYPQMDHWQSDHSSVNPTTWDQNMAWNFQCYSSNLTASASNDFSYPSMASGIAASVGNYLTPAYAYATPSHSTSPHWPPSYMSPAYSSISSALMHTLPMPNKVSVGSTHAQVENPHHDNVGSEKENEEGKEHHNAGSGRNESEGPLASCHKASCVDKPTEPEASPTGTKRTASEMSPALDSGTVSKQLQRPPKSDPNMVNTKQALKDIPGMGLKKNAGARKKSQSKVHSRSSQEPSSSNAA